MLPNKVISIEESVIWKLPYILDIVQKDDCSINKLYELVKNDFDDINEFLYALDILYVLESILFTKEYGVIKYVEKNQM